MAYDTLSPEKSLIQQIIKGFVHFFSGVAVVSPTNSRTISHDVISAFNSCLSQMSQLGSIGGECKLETSTLNPIDARYAKQPAHADFPSLGENGQNISNGKCQYM